ncbi:tyrosine-type recombinase/integrase [Nocardia aurea]|uniref:tyrosine-type recombinase/integrase n=1 Tax=Nocardia aurea TaxID=2144174 RepID=UPI001E4799B5|nr:site-specific integrase [Nocardia aurea]
MTRNVARLVELEKEQRGDITPWTAEETGSFLRFVESHPLYPAFLMLAIYGLRRGEVLGLRWQDIDWQRSQIHIRQQLQQIGNNLEVGPVKTNSGRRDLPLIPLVRDVLRRYQIRNVVELDYQYIDAIEGIPAEAEVLDEHTRQGGITGHVVRRSREDDMAGIILRGKNNSPLWPRNFVRTFHLLTKQAGLRRIKLHWLRHGTATLLKNSGVPDRDAQLIMGHAHISTTQLLYQHASSEMQKSGLDLIGRTLLGAGVRSRSRQGQPSSMTIVAVDTTISEPKKKVDLYSSRLLSMEGPVGLEPTTPCLKVIPKLVRDPLLTSVIQQLRTRTRVHVIGSVAVNLAVNPGRPNLVVWEWIPLRTALTPIVIPYLDHRS